ncbi:FAD/NAD-P-binding domain-containing protein [Mycena epipterygia]|nr:FAD/NAD-P-binding domain-containing protein [Mycena epipterygia]
MVVLNPKIILLTATILSAWGQQAGFASSVDDSSQWTTFPHPISRVAVIGAGPAGLQAAAHLLAANLSVRLFERAPSPGGNWFYTEDTPVREVYPGDTYKQNTELPSNLPTTLYYEDGEDGVGLDDRWKEHWQPRPVWYDLHTNSPASITELPGIKYAAKTPWSVSVHDVQRHVRAYASLHGINSNDISGSSSSLRTAAYSTRVENIQKCNATSTWTLTLRHLERLPESKRIKVHLWAEDFDAVVIATGLHTTPYVPAIEGIGNWSNAMQHGRHSMYHSQSYRHPERYSGKTVLIVGASVSATDIARSIAPFTHRLIASVRPNRRRDAYGLDILFGFPDKAEIVPEISSFEPLNGNDIGISAGKIRLINGTVILATGYRPNDFLPHLVNPRALDNLHWTEHYIHDPTLAYASAGRPWTHGIYQSLAFAKVWTGKARLPSPKQMWRDYQDKKYQFGGVLDILLQEALIRKFVAWLNSESLELGGQFVELPPIEAREDLAYFLHARWKQNWLTHENYTRFDNLPSSEWPKSPGSEGLQSNGLLW